VTLQSLVVQLINGLASASTLFLVAVGLSLIFGVTRIVNFAHGSLYMVGIYVAYSLIERLGPGSGLGFWTGVLLAAGVTAAIGAVIELLVLRRIRDEAHRFAIAYHHALRRNYKKSQRWYHSSNSPCQLLFDRHH
jgi:branched-chain amino acid transport system permease protein